MHIKNYNHLIYSSLLIIICIFSAWKFHSTYKPSTSFTNLGDGIGTMALFYSYKEYISENGLVYLLSDKWNTSGLGIDPSTIESSLFWRVSMFLTASFFSPDNTYDIIISAGYVLAFLAFVFLLRSLNINWVIAICGAFLLTNQDNFYVRASGHLALAIFFTIPLFLGMLIHTAKKPNLRNFILLGASYVLLLAVNEYYGFYCGITGAIVFPILLFVCYINNDYPSTKIKSTKILRNFIIASLITTALFILNYPLMLGEIFGIVTHVNENGIPNHPYEDFIIYNPLYPLYIFKSTLPFFDSLTETHRSFQTSVGEFLPFRIGILPLPIIIFGGLYYFYKFIQKRKSYSLCFFLFLSILTACIFLVFISFPVNVRYSLAIIPLKLGGIFRVGSRAYMVIDILILMLSFLCIDQFIRFCLQKITIKQIPNRRHLFIYGYGSLLLLSIVTFCALGYDMCGVKIFSKTPGVKLENTSIYSKIQNHDKGWLIEYPIDPCFVEGHYAYYYHHAFHNMPLVNFPYKNIDLRWFREKYKDLNEESLQFMHHCGVRFICLTNYTMPFFDHAVSIKTSNALKSSKYYKSIADQEGRIIYEAIITPDFAKNDIRAFGYDQPETRTLYTKGWSHMEPNRIWSIAKSSTIIFRTKNPKVITFKFQLDTIVPRTVSIKYQNKLLKTINLPQSGDFYEITLSLGKGDNCLFFETDNDPISPKNGDYRKLSFSLVNMSLVK